MPGLAGKYANKQRFRNPDTIIAPAKSLEEITEGKYTKTIGSTEIGKYLMQSENKSDNFNALVSGIRKVVESHTESDELSSSTGEPIRNFM